MMYTQIRNPFAIAVGDSALLSGIHDVATLNIILLYSLFDVEQLGDIYKTQAMIIISELLRHGPVRSRARALRGSVGWAPPSLSPLPLLGAGRAADERVRPVWRGGAP